VRRHRQGYDPEVNAGIARWSWRWALAATALQVVDGFVLLLLLPQPVLRGVMTGGVAVLGPLTVSILLGIGLLMMLSRVRQPVEKPALVTGTLATMTLVVAVMSVTRHQVRALYLAPSTSGFEFEIVPQWGNFVLFAVVLVAGLATVGWMIHRVVSSPATGADAA
jgi:hypothetical protein